MQKNIIGFIILTTITTILILPTNNVNARDSDYEDLPGDYPPEFPLFTWCGSSGADPDNCKPKPQVYCESKGGYWNDKNIECEGLSESDYNRYKDRLCSTSNDRELFGMICHADEIPGRS